MLFHVGLSIERDLTLILISGNVSPYSSGMPGASLTSTSVDPQTASSKLLWDEVRLHSRLFTRLDSTFAFITGRINV